MRLRRVVRGLRAAGRRARACEGVLRGVSLARTPEDVAARLVDLAFDWFGSPGWAVLAHHEGRGLTWLADRGVANTRRSALTALATRAVDSGRSAWAGDASRLGPTRLRGPFAALAMPLATDGRTIGALVGIDHRADEGAGPADLGPLGVLLDPVAAALDVHLRVERAERLSSIDDLTGLYNSRYLTLAIQRETKRALRTRRPLSVLFVDLDGFKGINDRWGHLCGSRALVEAAERIASGARESDVVARYGGDEFALILPDTPMAGALVVAQRIRERIAGHAFLEAEQIQYRLTASVGAATLPGAAATPEGLLAAADAAMYRVKARGKDGIEQAPGQAEA